MQGPTGNELDAIDDKVLDKITIPWNDNQFEVSHMGNYSMEMPEIFSSSPNTIIPDNDTELFIGGISLEYYPNEGNENTSNQTKQKRSVNVFKDFTDTPKKSRKKNKVPINKPREEPKKEYVRIKLLRGHKRATRFALNKDVFPRTTIIRVDTKNDEQKAKWNVFKFFTVQNKHFFEVVSKTDKGPLTDGEAKNKKQHGEHFRNVLKIERTFNNKFCSRYFADIRVRRSFSYYIEIIFKSSPEELCKKFNFRCCTGSLTHGNICKEKWEKLYIYCLNGLVKINCNDLEETKTNDVPEAENMDLSSFEDICEEMEDKKDEC
ncbi:hypothetical protein SteCoe_16666 [Stentor coeruleus]|uniref:Uncharacterized protein n=1 Tax=Stentor coeruleus TaxID=5963 RepID=A0A1R2C0V5_9CILI|nr:hypothetical protein SteCoe_16666 [Stentor coeruleus]